MAAKVCIKCRCQKDSSNFFKNKGCKDGLLNICKECSRIQHYEYRQAHKEYYRKKRRERYLLNREKNIATALQWNTEHKDRFRASKAKYTKKYQEKVKGSAKLSWQGR